MSAGPLSAEQVQAYHRDGYVVIPGLLAGEEIELLRVVAERDREVATGRGGADASGNETRIWITGKLGDDMLSAVARSHRVVDACEQVAGEELYHWHHKMTLKEPRVGGAWEWHQDYGYWYHNGCLWPRLVSCMIAVDRATPENGCLQVLRGSHLLGRIEHGKTGTQTGVADRGRLAEIVDRHETVHCELAPGDGLLFHCNTLHTSDANRSEHRRWAFLCCYNAASNDPIHESEHHPRYTPLEKAPDKEIMEAGRRQLERMEQASA